MKSLYCQSLRGGAASGDVFVTDPWDADNRQRVRVHIDVSPPLKVIPSEVRFDRETAGDGPGARAQVMILCREPTPDLVVTRDQGGRISPEISPLRMSADGRLATFSVSLPTGVETGEYRLRVSSPSTGASVLVPISVLEGARP